MTGLWLFANVALPIIVFGMGWIAVRLHARSARREDHAKVR